MKELLIALATTVALLGPAVAGGYVKEDSWTLNCRMEAIHKGRPDNADWDENTMVITRADLPALEKEIKKFMQCIAFWKCTEDRTAGKVKHCYENDKRWRNLK